MPTNKPLERSPIIIDANDEEVLSYLDDVLNVQHPVLFGRWGLICNPATGDIRPIMMWQDEVLLWEA